MKELPGAGKSSALEGELLPEGEGYGIARHEVERLEYEVVCTELAEYENGYPRLGHFRRSYRFKAELETFHGAFESGPNAELTLDSDDARAGEFFYRRMSKGKYRVTIEPIE